MSAELGKVSIVWKYRGGEFNWAVEYDGGDLTPAHREPLEPGMFTDLDLLAQVLEEGQAAAYALNTDAHELVKRYRTVKQNGRRPE